MQHTSMPGWIDPVAESQFIGNARSLHHRRGHTPQHHEEQTPEAAQKKNAEGDVDGIRSTAETGQNGSAQQ